MDSTVRPKPLIEAPDEATHVDTPRRRDHAGAFLPQLTKVTELHARLSLTKRGPLTKDVHPRRFS